MGATNALDLPREGGRKRSQTVGQHEGHRRQDYDSRRIVHHVFDQSQHHIALLLLRTVRLRHSPGRESEAMVAGGEHLTVAAVLLAAGHRHQGATHQVCVQHSRVSTAKHAVQRGGRQVGAEIPIGHGVTGLQAAQIHVDVPGAAETVHVRESEDTRGLPGRYNQGPDAGRRTTFDHVRGRADAVG